MNIPINNYRKYISGKLFAVCGVILVLLLLDQFIHYLQNPFDKDVIDIEGAITNFFATIVTLYAPPICLFLSLLEFLIRKYLKFQIKTEPFKNLNKLNKLLTILFWTSIMFSLYQFIMLLQFVLRYTIF